MKDRNASWRKFKLADVIDVKHGFAFKGEFFSEEPTADVLLTPGNFQIGGGFKADKFKYYRGEYPEEYVLNDGDIIITMTDLSKKGDTLGYPAKVPSPNGTRYLHNQRLGLVEFKSDQIDKDFLYWHLRTINYQRFIVNSASGSTVKHTSPSRIREYDFFAPGPLKEQRAIAKILSDLDEKIELNHRMNKTLEAIAQAIFKRWFVEAEADPVPLTNFIEFDPKITVKKNEVLPYVDMKELSIEGMSVFEVISKAFAGGSRFQNGDTLLARITPCLENGKTAFVNFLPDNQSTGFGSTEFIVMRAKEGISPQFVYCLARDPDFRSFAIKSMVGSSGRQRVQRDMLETYEIPKPDQKLMVKFHKATLLIFAQIRGNRKEIKNLSQIRDSLLPNLMSGEIRLGNSN